MVPRLPATLEIRPGALGCRWLSGWPITGFCMPVRISARKHPGFSPTRWVSGFSPDSLDSNLPAAARHYERALNLDPDNIYILSGAAVLLKALGRVSDALALEQHVVARDPLNPSIHHNAGVSYFHTGQWDQAIRSWRTVLRLSPGHVGAHFFIALALVNKVDPEAALAEAEKEQFEFFALAGKTTALHALGRTKEYEAGKHALVDEWSGQFPAIIGRLFSRKTAKSIRRWICSKLRSMQDSADASIQWTARSTRCAPNRAGKLYSSGSESRPHNSMPSSSNCRD